MCEYNFKALFYIRKEFIDEAKSTESGLSPHHLYLSGTVLLMTKKIRSLCETIHAVTQISILELNEEGKLIASFSQWENQMRNFFLLNFPHSLEEVTHKESTAPLYYSDPLHLNWFLLPYKTSFANSGSADSKNCFASTEASNPSEEKSECAFSTEDTENARGHFLLLGPVFETEYTPAFFQRKMEFQNMPVSSQLHFLKMLKDIPVLSTTHFQSYVNMLHYGLYHTLPKGTLSSLIPQTIEKEGASPSSVSFCAALSSRAENTGAKSVRNIPLSHGSRSAEKMMLENVRTGTLTEFVDSRYSASYTAGMLSPNNPLRQAKNLIITQTTLVTRAAVDGGMDTEEAYTLSDYFIQRIELCETPNEVYALSREIYRTYVTRVRDIRMSGYSALVKHICIYIDKHIFEVISLKEIAEELGYDTYYLSSLFHKETGKTLKSWILEKKVIQAKILLETTQLESWEISERLAFQTPTYFSTQFKKCTGEAPLAYRKHMSSPVL